MAYNSLNISNFIKNESISGDFTSVALQIQFQDNIALQLIWTGDLEGIFSVQVSLDHKQTSEGVVTVPGTWVDIPVSPEITANGVGDSGIFDLNQLPESYLRVVFSHDSGSGTLNGYYGAKAV